MVMVAVRVALLALASQPMVTVVEPVPVAAEATRAQAAELVVVHAQPAPVVRDSVVEPAREPLEATLVESEGLQAKVAVTFCAAVMLMAPPAVAPPVQPVKMYPVAGPGLSWTGVPEAYQPSALVGAAVGDPAPDVLAWIVSGYSSE